jgi:hypothetical protein
MDKHLKMYPANSWTIKGTLKKIKEDQRLIIYDLKTPLQGLTGSVYIHCEQSHNHLWDKLVLEKESSI